MLVITWIAGLLRHRRARLVSSTLGVAIAVGLLATVGVFLSASKTTMTQRASASAIADWQVEVQPGVNPGIVGAAVRSFTGLKSVMTVNLAPTTGLELTKDGSTQSTGAGVVVGLPATYSASFADSIRTLAGKDRGVVLAQQTAANLHASPGDTVTVGRAGLAPATVKVVGVIDLLSADSFFQNVGATPLSQPTSPPDNVVFVPPAQWHALFDPVGVVRPDLITTQFHADFARSLPTDPSAAYFNVLSQAHNLELKLQGGGLVGNNLAAKLGKARSDSLYAQILFLFLGVPGAVLAGFLTATVASMGADRRRRDQALLRTRGATLRQLVSLGIGEAAVVTVVGSAGGLGLALAVGSLSFGSATFGASTPTVVVWILGAVLVGALIAGLSIAWPAYREACELTVASARRVVGRGREPRWLRWRLDIALLALAAAVFWATSRNGFKLVLAVEGVPQISVNYWAFAGPALAWIGGAMLLWRLANTALRARSRLFVVLLRPLCGGLAGTVAASMNRQRQLLARGLCLVALTAAFCGSTAVFNFTYEHQAEVDAVLTNGAMVTVVEPPGVLVGPSKAEQFAAIPGVRSVTALQHRFAYVGADLQDLYGVDPKTIVKATRLRDPYFKGGSANGLMAKLAAKPDAVLVSPETVKDFQLRPGDTIRLRLQDGRTKQYVVIPFTYVGMAVEFPTAPSDSFLVANAAYVAEATGNDSVGSFLLDTASQDSTTVAARVQKMVGTTATVEDIASKRRRISNSLTAVELRGLTKVELGFGVVLAAAASGLVLWLGLFERRRTFAVAAALGASPRQLGGFVWSEAVFVTAGGALLGALMGWGLTMMIVRVLNGVFDPPPSTLSVPWGYLGIVAVVLVLSVVAGATAAVRATRRPTIEMLRDL